MPPEYLFSKKYFIIEQLIYNKYASRTPHSPHNIREGAGHKILQPLPEQLSN